MTIKNILFGLVIGALMLIPGVSGGSIAVFLGIYDKIIDIVANFKNDIKNNFLYLSAIFIGCATSVVIFSVLFNELFYRFETMITTLVGTFFVCISIDDLISNKQIRIIKKLFLFFIGIIIPLFLLFIPVDLFQKTNFIFSVFIGFPLSIALILPGISFSYCLLIFGIYDEVLLAIKNLDILFLLPLIIGVLVGVFLFSKILNYFLKKSINEIMCLISGFVFFSSISLLKPKNVFDNKLLIFIVIISIITYIIYKFVLKKIRSKKC